MNQNFLTVAELVAHLLLLPNQEAVVTRYYPGNAEFVPVDKQDFEIVSAEAVDNLIAPQVLGEGKTAIQVLCVNTTLFNAIEIEMQEGETEGGLLEDVIELNKCIDNLAEAISLLSPESEAHRITNVNGLAAFNDMKASGLKALATGSQALTGLVSIVNYDQQLEQEQAIQDHREQELLERTNLNMLSSSEERTMPVTPTPEPGTLSEAIRN